MMAKFELDPGHGAQDPGAVGKRSKEKDNVLKVALRVKALLEAAGHTVRMTRSTDVFVTLSNRAKMANSWGADYFVSMHNNAATAAATGFETFIYSGEVSTATRKLQNAVHNAIAGSIGIVDRGRKRANYSVLRETEMPAVLIEYAFISNQNDESILINEVEKMAQLTAKGLLAVAGGKLVAAAPQKSAVKPEPKAGKLTVELEFSSGTLRDIVKTFLGSKGQQEIAVRAAAEHGFSDTWIEKQAKRQAKDGDLVALMIGAGVKEFK